MSALWSWIHNSMFNHKVQPVVFKLFRCPRCWHQTKEGLISENSFWRRSGNYKWIWKCTDSIYSAENKLGPLRSSLWSWIHFNMFKSNHKLLDVFMVLSPYYGHPNTCMSGSLLHGVGGFCGSDITVTTCKLSNAGPCGALMVLNPPLGSSTEATICRYFQLALSDLYVEQKLSQCGAVPFS